MPPRKSSRLAFIGPKTKKTKKTSPISIQDDSTNSESNPQTLTSEGIPREIRSKSSNDHEMSDENTPKSQEREGVEKHGSETVSEPNSESERDSEDLNETLEEVLKKVPKKKEISRKKTTSKESQVGELKRKRKESSSKVSKRRKTEEHLKASNKTKKLFPNKVLECAFIDFKFFNSNGFYWNHWLDRIGCRKICQIMDVVEGSMINEFYDNLEEIEDSSLRSKVLGKSISITRKDLIKCFDMLDVKDNEWLMNLSRSAVYKELNDGIGEFHEKDIFSTNFELLVRLLHKVVVDCILPKNGSTTTISKREGLVVLAIKKKLKVDMPRMILRHMWRIRRNKPYGNLLMKLFKYKKIALPKNFKIPLTLKRIGESNLKYMGILVSDKFWFTMDGTWYRHPKFSKFSFDWKKIKAIAEGEVILEKESGSEVDEEDEEGKKDDKTEETPSRRAGKEILSRKSKKDYKIRTGGKFEIKEGQGNQDSESESESD